jgi:hypothetical protein
MLRLGPHHKFTGSDEDGGALPIQESIVTKKSHGSFVILAALVILFGTHKKIDFLEVLDNCSNQYWRWGGRGFCSGAGKTRSEENARKCRRIPTCPLHLRRMDTSSFPKETGAQWEYTANWQTHKPYKAMETRLESQSRAAPWFPVQLIHPLVAWRPGVNDPD